MAGTIACGLFGAISGSTVATVVTLGGFVIPALLANGWFLRVKSLLYSPGLDVGPSRVRRLYPRWLVFFAFWIGALYLLPTALVGLAFAGWFAWVVRDIRTAMGKLQVQKELVPENQGAR